MKIKRLPIICPVCHVGDILRVRVKKTGDYIYICRECDAVWFCMESIKFETYNIYGIYMNRLGLKDSWDEIDYSFESEE